MNVVAIIDISGSTPPDFLRRVRSEMLRDLRIFGSNDMLQVIVANGGGIHRIWKHPVRMDRLPGLWSEIENAFYEHGGYGPANARELLVNSGHELFRMAQEGGKIVFYTDGLGVA